MLAIAQEGIYIQYRRQRRILKYYNPIPFAGGSIEPQSTQREKDLIFDALKRALKVQKITYRELAKRLKMSEPSIKRIFSSRTCTLDRVLEICAALKISFADVMQASKNLTPPTHTLKPETEAFFVANFEHFIFYRKLGTTPDVKKLCREEGLDLKMANRYLKKLADLDLIDVESTGAIRFRTPVGYLKLTPNGRLEKLVRKNWILEMARIVPDKNDEQHKILAMSTGLSPANRAALQKDLEDLFDRYRRAGFTDQTFQNFESVGLAVLLGPYRIGTLGRLS